MDTVAQRGTEEAGQTGKYFVNCKLSIVHRYFTKLDKDPPRICEESSWIYEVTSSNFALEARHALLLNLCLTQTATSKDKSDFHRLLEKACRTRFCRVVDSLAWLSPLNSTTLNITVPASLLTRSIVLAPPFARTLWYPEALAESDLPVLTNQFGLDLIRVRSESVLVRLAQRCRLAAVSDIQTHIADPRHAILARRDFLLAEQREAIGRAANVNDVLNGPGRLFIYPNYCLVSHYAYPFLLPSNSPYSSALRRVLRALVESGLTLHWLEKDRWRPPPMYNKYLDSRSKRERPLTLSQVQPVLVVYSCSLVVIAVVFGAEVLVASVWRHEISAPAPLVPLPTSAQSLERGVDRAVETPRRPESVESQRPPRLHPGLSGASPFSIESNIEL
ncbi:uncharacterized protein LOC117638981 isoform X1 [Thrips palmi]|uniref:Uncharacterized protein LOC117638981 isoform X1 n=1 Tax=Thrips palmi TaxID=161013 RepID=A0A6P8Y8T1_THRPL|nr:uncharacterized protein LOC117638981 isoform X1 [Thrips palmi]